MAISPAIPTPLPSSSHADALTAPRQRAILMWLFAGRTVLGVGTLLAAAIRSAETPYVSFLLSIAVVVTLVASAYGYWRIRIAQGSVSPGFLLWQSLSDLLLVTMLVYNSPSPTIFGSLYVVIIAAYSVLMTPGWSAAVMVAGTAAYALDVLVFRTSGDTVAFWVQVALFATVYAIVSVLGQRLRRADVQQVTLEYELRRARLEADVILQNIHSGVLTVDAEGRLAFVNPTAERLLGLTAAEHLGRPILDVLKQRSGTLEQAVRTGIRENRRVGRGEGVVRAAGRSFPIGLSTTTFQQEDQAAPSVTAIFTEISELKQLQELHVRAERLEAVAALSASLAHEIKNPLAAIRSSCEQLARARQASEDDRMLAGLIVRESDRLSRLLSEFLDFARVRATKAEPLDLLEVVRAATSMVKAHPSAAGGSTLEVEGTSTILEGDEDLLHRVVANLVLNAVQAGDGKPVRVRVRVEAVPGPELPAGANFPAGVRLVVADDGPGIPEEIMDSVFQPFVSRRPGGSGLGLAIVQRAVEAHRGLVFVQSKPGSGTTFTILLPAMSMAEDVA
ncbi:MAG TPA: ATP-binding protein [Gemmatimonadales bacterium]|nr:ATP-binding protein [Gemmatimonadales bacterium]